MDSLVITGETSISNFPAWDSIAMVQIVLAIETEFQIRFTTDEVAAFKSVQNFIDYIDRSN
jgi:acyl carrier protein